MKRTTFIFILLLLTMMSNAQLKKIIARQITESNCYGPDVRHQFIEFKPDGFFFFTEFAGEFGSSKSDFTLQKGGGKYIIVADTIKLEWNVWVFKTPVILVDKAGVFIDPNALPPAYIEISQISYLGFKKEYGRNPFH